MPDLSVSSSLSGDPAATRVVVVRDAPRSVRLSDEPSRFGARTLFWTAIALGFVGLLWLTGHLGERLGFAAALGVPELLVSPDAGLAAGVRIALSLPRIILAMAMAEPMLLAPAFVLISAPAAALAVARPRTPGGPPPGRLELAWSRLGLIAACLTWAGLLAWINLPARVEALAPLPLDREEFRDWPKGIAAIAGADFFAMIASVLWLVLLFRLPMPRVAVALAAVAGFAATIATWSAFATSAGLHDGLRLPRPVILIGGGRSLLVGTLLDRALLLSDSEAPTLMTVDEPNLGLFESRPLAEWMVPRGSR